MAPKGGQKPPDFKVRPPTAGGRSDMSGTQPVRVATGLPYGSRTALEHAQEAVPLPQTQVGQGGGLGAPAPGGLEPSQDLLGLLAHPTQRPMEAVTQAPPTFQDPVGHAAFKVDVLQHLASLPFASPETQQMLSLAQTELAIAHSEENYPTQGPWPSGQMSPMAETVSAEPDISNEAAPEMTPPEEGIPPEGGPAGTPPEPEGSIAPPTG